MNLKDLAYFHQLIQDQNFTKVAEHFHVSQPTITVAMKRLEKEFDTKLIERNYNHNELRITASGRQLYHHIVPMLNEWRLAHQEIQAMNQQIIRFGMSPTISNYFFPNVTSQLIKNDLLNHLQTYEAGSRDVLRAILDGEIDIGVIGGVTPVVDTQLVIEPLKTMQFRIIVGQSNPLASRQSIQFKEASAFPFIILNNSFVNPVAFEQISHASGVDPRILYRSNNIDTLKRIVARNDAISYIAELSILPSDPIVSIPLTDRDQPLLTILLVYRKTLEVSEREQQFMQIIRKFKSLRPF